MPYLIRALCPLLVLGVLGGCISASGGPLPAARAGSTVEVTNNHWSDMKIYLDREGTRFRIGTVGSMQTETLRIRAGLPGAGRDLRVVAVPIAGRTAYVSDPFPSMPGQRLELTVQNYLPISSLVWRR